MDNKKIFGIYLWGTSIWYAASYRDNTVCCCPVKLDVVYTKISMSVGQSVPVYVNAQTRLNFPFDV